jgi:hypothetical protein
VITQVMSSDELIDSTLRRETLALLRECTGAQRTRFDEVFPNGLDALNTLYLAQAYELCRQMVEKTRELRAAEASQR